MKSAVNKTFSSTFISRSKVILLGTIISQAITFVSSLIITKYYLPEDLGVLGVLTALISIIAGTLSFRMDVSIIQAKEDEAYKVFAQSTLFSMLSSLIFCLICFVLPWDFAKNISTYFFFFLCWTWGYFIFFNSKQLNFRFNELSDNNKGTIGRSVFLFVFYWMAGVFRPTFNMLLSGRVLSDFFGALFHLRKYISKIFDPASYRYDWGKFFSTHKEYFFFMTPHHLCIALSNNILILFLENRFALYEVGLFALAQRLIQAPIEMLGNTMANTSLKRFSELKDNQNHLKKFLYKIMAFSVAVAAMTGLVMYVTVDYAFSFLRPEWQNAASMVKALTPYFAALIIMNPITNYLRIIGRSRIQLVMEVIEIVMKIGFLVTLPLMGSHQLILAFGCLCMVIVFVKLVIIARLSPTRS